MYYDYYNALKSTYNFKGKTPKRQKPSFRVQRALWRLSRGKYLFPEEVDGILIKLLKHFHGNVYNHSVPDGALIIGIIYGRSPFCSYSEESKFRKFYRYIHNINHKKESNRTAALLTILKIQS